MALLTKAGIQRSAYGALQSTFDHMPEDEDGFFPANIRHPVGEIEFFGRRYEVEIVARLVTGPMPVEPKPWENQDG